MGSLIPPEGQRPKFAQLYVHDTEDEVTERLSNFSSSKQSLKPEIVAGLMNMFDETNELVKSYRRVGQQLRDPSAANLRLRITGARVQTDRQYSLPTGSEIAGLIPGDFRGDDEGMDIIVDHQGNGLQRVSSLHPKFSALHFPILFPYGEDGFHLGIEYNPLHTSPDAQRGEMTEREFHCFRLQHRDNEGHSLMRGGKALQHYCVDAFSTIEQNRLRFLRANQRLLRAELYCGLRDAYNRGDLTGRGVGATVLPGSHTGSHRYMKRLYLDAMAICRHYGNPDLFLTFTCNTTWLEILNSFSDVVGTRSEHKPDIVCRVFKMKIQYLDTIIGKGAFFGKTLCVMYTVEFQKRGLPHIHMLVWLDHSAKLTSIEDIDAMVSAEIPDPDVDPLGYAAVSKYMMHGPCGAANPKAPCMQDGRCTKFFPKAFNSATSYDHNGHVVYRRRDTGLTVEKNGCALDNRYVVPYNRNLLVLVQAHLNVEICHKGGLIKYLFKYVTKGPDRAVVVAETSSDAPGASSSAPLPPMRDEIKQYLDCRVLSSYEAVWRLFEYPLHDRTTPVTQLHVHLKDRQPVPYLEDELLADIIRRAATRDTTLTAWFALNERDPEARKLTYAEIPGSYTFNEKQRRWIRRKRGFALGRISYVPPGSNDVYYLRLLLTKVRGPTSFEDLRTVDGVLCESYQEACLRRGFLIDDDEPQGALTEVSQWAMPAMLRSLFVSLLKHSEVADPAALFEANWKVMADDFAHRPGRHANLMYIRPSDEYLRDWVLKSIEALLRVHSLTLADYHLPQPANAECPFLTNRLLSDHLDFDLAAEASLVSELLPTLNYSQAVAYHRIMDSISSPQGRFFFLYGHGGTGKTYLYSAITATLRSQQDIVLVIASSGIAATLLPGGLTAHSRFKIPIHVDGSSTCQVKRGTQLGELLQRCKLIIWDEAPMVHRFCFEAVDRTLCDIMELSHRGTGYTPFGGKTMLLGGDFRQILPVITNAGKEETMNASITNSHLWKHCSVLRLSQNMRINAASINSELLYDGMTFPEWVLSVGNGTTPSGTSFADSDATWIRIPDSLLLPADEDEVTPIVDFVYTDFEDSFASVDYLQNWAIITPTNDVVSAINLHLLNKVPGETKTYYSSDSLCPETADSDGLERLYPEEFLNSLSFKGMPEHELSLKLYTPVMLMRNLNPSAGLCNGTRLLITHLGNKVLKGVIITGSFKGTVVAIPRIVLNLNDNRWPFTMKRAQFPVRLCYAMTINKSQGQSLDRVGVYLPKPVFSHGQLYVAASVQQMACASRSNLKKVCPTGTQRISCTSKSTLTLLCTTIEVLVRPASVGFVCPRAPDLACYAADSMQCDFVFCW